MRAADGIVLPGVGAFPQGDGAIRRLGLDELIARAGGRSGVPMLGVCLGMQLLFERSTELGGAAGLGPARPARSGRSTRPGLKVPQIGWNAIAWRRASRL